MTSPPESRLELADPQAYVTRQTRLVGSRDPLEVLASTPDEIEATIADHSPAVLQRRPFEGKWTPTEVIGHLIDVEWTYGFRTRMIAAHDRPELTGMDQDLWVSAQRYNEYAAQELAAAFRSLRSVNLAFWGGMRATELERFGVHSERGNESLAHIRMLMAGHDLWHLDQLRRYAAQAATSRER